jgi:hypothetical protein
MIYILIIDVTFILIIMLIIMIEYIINRRLKHVSKTSSRESSKNR